MLFQNQYQTRCQADPAGTLLQAAVSEGFSAFSTAMNQTAAQDGNVSSGIFGISDDSNTELCSNKIYFNDTLRLLTLVITTTSILVLVTMVGDVMIMIIIFVDASLNLPVFIAMQSLSVITILSTLDIIVRVHWSCEVDKFLMFLPGNYIIYCRFQHTFTEYLTNMVFYHLIIIILQRVIMTVWPLRSHLYMTSHLMGKVLVVLYIGVLLVEVIMTFFPLSPTILLPDFIMWGGCLKFQTNVCSEVMPRQNKAAVFY